VNIKNFRAMLIKTEICKMLIRLLEADTKLNSIILQIIINLSAEDQFQKQFVELNSINRIISIYSEVVKTFNPKSNKEASTTFEVKKMLDKYILNSNQNNISMDKKSYADIPYYLMTLTNLTVTEHGQKSYLRCDDEKVKGIKFLQMLDNYLGNIYLNEFDFYSNILANVSSLKEGRVILLEFKLFKLLINFFDRLNCFKLINSLRMVRNCCFEFEKYEEDLMTNNGKLIDVLVKILFITNSNLTGFDYEYLNQLDLICFTHFNKEQASSEKDEINDLVVDILLILTNSPKAIENMKIKKTKIIIEKLYNETIEKNSDLRDKMFAISSLI